MTASNPKLCTISVGSLIDVERKFITLCTKGHVIRTVVYTNRRNADGESIYRVGIITAAKCRRTRPKHIGEPTLQFGYTIQLTCNTSTTKTVRFARFTLNNSVESRSGSKLGGAEIILKLHWHKNYFAMSRLSHLLNCWEKVVESKVAGKLKVGNLRASNCLICMAAGEAKISAACLINLAASTSARAAMTLDSPILFCWAADDKEAETSALKMISLIRIPSMVTPHLSATSPTISAISNAIASRSVTRL